MAEEDRFVVSHRRTTPDQIFDNGEDDPVDNVPDVRGRPRLLVDRKLFGNLDEWEQ